MVPLKSAPSYWTQFRDVAAQRDPAKAPVGSSIRRTADRQTGAS